MLFFEGVFEEVHAKSFRSGFAQYCQVQQKHPWDSGSQGDRLESATCSHKYPLSLSEQGPSGVCVRETIIKLLTGASSSLPSALPVTVLSVSLPEENAEGENWMSFPQALSKSGTEKKSENKNANLFYISNRQFVFLVLLAWSLR